jgi:hypothetical protein
MTTDKCRRNSPSTATALFPYVIGGLRYLVLRVSSPLVTKLVHGLSLRNHCGKWGFVDRFRGRRHYSPSATHGADVTHATEKNTLYKNNIVVSTKPVDETLLSSMFSKR